MKTTCWMFTKPLSLGVGVGVGVGVGSSVGGGVPLPEGVAERGPAPGDVHAVAARVSVIASAIAARPRDGRGIDIEPAEGTSALPATVGAYGRGSRISGGSGSWPKSNSLARFPRTGTSSRTVGRASGRLIEGRFLGG